MDTSELQRRSDILSGFSRKEFEWACDHVGLAPFGEHDDMDMDILNRESHAIDCMLHRARIEEMVDRLREGI